MEDIVITEHTTVTERVQLMFAFTHPAIDKTLHAPLLLQCVVGVDVASIAKGFLFKPETLRQRLSRAKSKIRDADMAFEIPPPHELPARLDAVLEAIHAAFGRSRDDIVGANVEQHDFSTQALELVALLHDALPREPEICGLLSLLLFCQSRKSAQRNDTDIYVPLLEQNTSQWAENYIRAAENYLILATHASRVGRFQLEAAIQSVHAQRRLDGNTDWHTIAQLYEGLVHLAPSVGALLGYAAASAHVAGAQHALNIIGDLPPQSVSGYQPYWALRAHLLQQLQCNDEARDAYEHAIGLCTDAAMREFLQGQSNRMAENPSHT